MSNAYGAGAKAGGEGAGRGDAGVGSIASASGLGAVPRQKKLRDLVRASPLIAPEMRAHWLRVLPHLTAEQRQELWSLLAPADPSASMPARAAAPPASVPADAAVAPTSPPASAGEPLASTSADVKAPPVISLRTRRAR